MTTVNRVKTRAERQRLSRERQIVGALPVGTSDAAMRYLFPEPAPYLDKPVEWVQDRIPNGFVWSKQREILESVRDCKYTAVKACHGPGKSDVASKAVGWWIDVHDIGSAFVVTTAPSWPQVQAILWRYLRRMHSVAGLPGRITLDCMWHMGDGRSSEELIAMGRKPADYDEQAFQGIHARHILIVIDESCGVDTPLWNAVLSLATNENARVLAIGNPDDPSSYFADVCKTTRPRQGTQTYDSDLGWRVITISAFDTPNFTGEPIPEWLAQDLVHPDWVAERARDWGIDSPVYISKVLGEFPDISDDYLITPAMLAKAYATNLPGLGKGRYGCDIARMGVDKTVIYRNRDNVIRFEESWGKLDTMKTAGRIKEKLERHGIERVPATIDSIGVGAGVLDRLKEQNLEVIGFQGSERAFRPEKFKNRRSEVYWEFRNGLEDGIFDLDEKDTTLASELTSIKCWIDSGGRVVVESKDDMRERGIKSPDNADACVYSTVHRAMVVDQSRPVPGSIEDELSRLLSRRL